MKTDEELMNSPVASLTKEELYRRRAFIAETMEAYDNKPWTDEDVRWLEMVVVQLKADKATKH